MPNKVFTSATLTAADVNDYLMEQVIATGVSSSRPTGMEGRFIAETDTDKLMSHDGTDWRTAGGFGWKSFTPSWTNFSIGNGTQSGEYRYVQGGMWVEVNVELGSTSSVSGSIILTLPASEAMRTAAQGLRQPRGDVTFTDTGTAIYQGAARYNNSTSVVLVALNASGTYLSHTNTSSTVPFTWTTGDLFSASFFAPLT